MSIVVSVLTVTAKTQLVILGTVLYKEPWPSDRLLLALRIGAFVLAGAALVLFPRHEAVEESSGAALTSPARERA